MTAKLNKESARIYEFPVGGRKAVEGNSRRSDGVTQVSSLRIAKTACSDGWYHDAAVAEAELARKR